MSKNYIVTNIFNGTAYKNGVTMKDFAVKFSWSIPIEITINKKTQTQEFPSKI